MPAAKTRLIESDDFPFEFVSQLAERESWRKEVHRPIYHVHKWWAKRLGSVFRGILLGSVLPPNADLAAEFYRSHAFSGETVFDPFMGSGTTIGEAHKLGFTALGRDINPVAVEAVTTAFGPMDRQKVLDAFDELSSGVGKKIRELYLSVDSRSKPCDVLYYFWVMQANCPDCTRIVDLFSSYIIARNAYPDRKPEVQIVCPACGDIFPGLNSQESVECRSCSHEFNPLQGPAHGAKASCKHCHAEFKILDALSGKEGRPDFRLYGKLVLTSAGHKEYLRATDADQAAFDSCSAAISRRQQFETPDLKLAYGYNTRQAMNYGFNAWKDFFNDRQLLALGLLRSAICDIADEPTRRALLTLFSGVLEFNNLFASYKGEGTGAVRHMFSHHILKPERTPIEANVWGTPKSSGSFSNLFKSRLLRAIDYRHTPTEVNGRSGHSRVCSSPFSGEVSDHWPVEGNLATRGIYLSCGDSAKTGLPDQGVDLVITDPPFFDNVHYSELADFFFAWQQLTGKKRTVPTNSTRSPSEVQDGDAPSFARKLQAVFTECHRILKDDGLLVFTYHHSRDEGWESLAEAIIGAGFTVVNSQPVKAEMSIATPKSQAKEPIQLDIILVCRKRPVSQTTSRPVISDSIESANLKIKRLHQEGFQLSRNDRKIVLYGQLLTSISMSADLQPIAARVEAELIEHEKVRTVPRKKSQQGLLFSEPTAG